MNTDEIQKLLQKYNISELDELENILDKAEQDCDDDVSIEEGSKYCRQAKCFNVGEAYGIPACRRLIEIQQRFYSKNIKEFANILYEAYQEEVSRDHKVKKIGLSSIEGYLSCKSCDGLKNLLFKNSVFVDMVCLGLSEKLDKATVFEGEIRSIKQFKKRLLPITKENFVPLSHKDDRQTMNKEEQDRLYDFIHVTRSKLKQNLLDKDKTAGSPEYKMNLALYAFERNLSDESLLLVESLQYNERYKTSATFLHLHAKLLSNLQRDEEAIIVLEQLLTNETSYIDIKGHNLLAASIKRKAINDFFNVSHQNSDNVEVLSYSLTKANAIYKSLFHITCDYYSAINIIYLEMMIAYIEGGNQDLLEVTRINAKRIWKDSNIQSELANNDWWSFISNVEYFILMTEYAEAIKKLQVYIEALNQDEVSDFSIASTIRQLELYKQISSDSKLGDFLEQLKEIESNKNRSKYIKE